MKHLVSNFSFYIISICALVNITSCSSRLPVPEGNWQKVDCFISKATDWEEWQFEPNQNSITVINHKFAPPVIISYEYFESDDSQSILLVDQESDLKAEIEIIPTSVDSIILISRKDVDIMFVLKRME